MLFEKDRHSKLGDVRWNSSFAHEFIEQLYLFTERDFDHQEGWTQNKAANSGSLRFSLYDGAAGIAWSQACLSRWGYGKENYDYQDFLKKARALHLGEIKKVMPSNEYLNGLLVGELGILVAESAFNFTDQLAKDFFLTMSQLQDNSVCDYMWGITGALIVAIYHMNMKSRPEFCKIAIEMLSNLENQLSVSKRIGVKLWRQNLYGYRVSHLGAVHGFAGNAFGILRSMPILDSETANKWKSLIIDTITNTALIEGKLANWPQSIDGQRPGRDALLVQFCHGSPGIICCIADLMGLDEDFDRLMLAGGELAWHAGPLKKGGNICHGAAGTGYSFLKLFDATGDELWLDRARAFAAFGIQKAQEQRESADSFHYSLWNGDTGLAHFVHNCLNQTSEIPTMDYF